MRRSYKTSDRQLARALVAAGALVLGSACGSAPEPQSPEISIGLLLSYTGAMSANSINSDRALRMAIEAANAAGGVAGRPLRLVARDTGSDPSKVTVRAREIVDSGAAVIIGPDTNDLALSARGVLQDRTLILPSFATSSDVLYKTASWFVIGAPIGRLACELAVQLHADQRERPLIIFNPSGYSASIAWTLTNQYGFPRVVLPANEVPSTATLAAITKAKADAFVLAAFPASAVSLVDALLASGTLSDPKRWYLSPPLHSPVFLDLVPRGGLTGARGVSQGTATEAAAFRDRFFARWSDGALDDAYPFYDAGALAVLSLQRALIQKAAVPEGTGLTEHIIAVTTPGGTPVHWNEIDR
jgi:ABC-type branched-subunit amino acid transport system substrate-binding protein